MKHLRKAVVTGGNGYIGSVLVQTLLSGGIDVHAIVHHNREHLDSLLAAEQIHIVTGADSLLSSLIRDLQPDVIFHLASLHADADNFDQLMAMVETNIRMGTALLHGASQCASKPVFVNTGTYWQFADGEQYSPNTFYAATKQSFHDLMLYFSRSRGVPAMTLILYDSFGPRDTRSKLWNSLLHAPGGSLFPLTEGRQYLELLHVEDIARAFVHGASMLLAGEGLNRTFAVRSKHPIRLRTILEDLQSHGVLDLQFEWGAIPYSSAQVFQPWRGEVLPGWSPTLDVHVAVADWLRNERANKIRRG